LASVTLFTT